VNEQVHTKAKLSWVVFLSCFISVSRVFERKLPRKREEEWKMVIQKSVACPEAA